MSKEQSTLQITPDNSYSFILSPILISAKTKKGRSAQITNLFYEPLRFPKQVVAAGDAEAIRQTIMEVINSGRNSVGVATCYKNITLNNRMVGIEGHLLTAPWWVGIKDKNDISAFFEGGEKSRGEYWEKGYLYYQQDPDLVETVLTTNPRNYGADEESNFVARVRFLPLGGFEGEMTLGTLSLRALEGQIERSNLIRFIKNHGTLSTEFDIGSNYSNDPVALGIIKGLAKDVFYKWVREPVNLIDFFEVIKLHGFDTIELIGEHQDGIIKYFKIFEIR